MSEVILAYRPDSPLSRLNETLIPDDYARIARARFQNSFVPPTKNLHIFGAHLLLESLERSFYLVLDFLTTCVAK